MSTAATNPAAQRILDPDVQRPDAAYPAFEARCIPGTPHTYADLLALAESCPPYSLNGAVCNPENAVEELP